MKSTSKILKKVISLLMIFIIFINYSYPAIVYAADWPFDYNENLGGEFKDYTYDGMKEETDSTWNNERAHIAFQGVIMQADAINELLSAEVLDFAANQGHNPKWPRTPGEPQYIITDKELKSTVPGKEVSDLIKEKIKEMGKGSNVVRDYATTTLETNLDWWIENLTPTGNTATIPFDRANYLATQKRDKIDNNFGQAGGTAMNQTDDWREDMAQDYEPADWSLGGLLLDLLFALVNFVADSIVASMNSIMEGTGGLSLGWNILTSTRQNVPEGVEESELTKVSTKGWGAVEYPNIKYTPEKIFAGKVDLLSIDFISGKVAEKDDNGNLVKDDDGNIVYSENKNSGWNGIRATISQWYQVLRLVAIIGLLSVLIYTGIKIILSANAKDKAKYKEWIMSWFMAVAILFSMHFIMAFIIAVTGEVSLLITEVSKTIYVATTGGSGGKFATNLMGLVRFMVQSNDASISVAYEVMYIALIVYTIKFTFVYLKRVFNMAFLTLIAPIVALTYPIDKINDGKAQGFDMWLKEYTFNALLQPMHCILYYVLVGSAVGVAGSNPIYGIAVLAFMTEAEKLLKKIFGFDKANAGTVGGVGSAFAAGAIASSIAKMAKLPKGNAGRGGNGGSGNDDTALNSPKPTNKPGMDVFNDEQPELPSGGSSAADAFQNSDDPVRDSRREELEERLADGQISENELSAEDKAILGIGTTSSEESSDSGEQESANGDSGQTDQQSSQPNGDSGQTNQQSSQPNGDSGEPVRQMAAAREEQRQQNKESGGFAKGVGAVGKKILKPVWDLDKSKSYNFKRLGKGALKGTAKVLGGFALGATAAAVQAGISITDGKYNPMEGVAAVTAGFAGAGGIVNKVSNGLGSAIDTYREGSLPDDPKERNKEIMIRAQKRFADRDDVIAFNKKNYPGKEKEAMERQRDNYLTAGVTDLKEMKSGMKYADTLVGKTDGLTAEQIKAKRKKADEQAAATINFKKTLSEQGQVESIRNAKKQKTYIDTMVAQASDADKARVRRQYENAFKAVAAYDLANA